MLVQMLIDEEKSWWLRSSWKNPSIAKKVEKSLVMAIIENHVSQTFYAHLKWYLD